MQIKNLVFGIVVMISVIFISLPYVSDVQYVSVLSDSMSPALNVGDVVVVAPTGQIREGDIVSFMRGRTLITHRVIGIDGETLTTKGDANEDSDMGTIDRSQVMGGVLFAIPLMGTLASFVKTLYGFIIFVVVPGLLIIGYELRAIYNRKKTKAALVSTAYVLSIILVLIIIGACVTLAYFSDVETAVGNVIHTGVW